MSLQTVVGRERKKRGAARSEAGARGRRWAGASCRRRCPGSSRIVGVRAAHAQLDVVVDREHRAPLRGPARDTQRRVVDLRREVLGYVRPAEGALEGGACPKARSSRVERDRPHGRDERRVPVLRLRRAAGPRRARARAAKSAPRRAPRAVGPRGHVREEKLSSSRAQVASCVPPHARAQPTRLPRYHPNPLGAAGIYPGSLEVRPEAHWQPCHGDRERVNACEPRATRNHKDRK